MSSRARLVAAAAGLLLGRAFAAVPAGAQRIVLTLQLDVAVEHQPDHLCIVSAGGTDAPVSIPLGELAKLRAEAADLGGAAARRGDRAPEVWRFEDGTPEDSSRRASLLSGVPHVRDAIGALVPGASRAGECNAGSVCAPGFEIAPHLPRPSGQLHIACARNVRTTEHEVRLVAVVFLNTHFALAPPLVQIALDGTVASVDLLGHEVPKGQEARRDEVFVASVLGGHYAPGATATSADGRIILALAPRCQLYDVGLPLADQRAVSELSVELREGKERVLSCLGSVVDGFVRVRLPHRPTEAVRVLELSDRSQGGTGLRFIATWTEPTPPRQLQTTLRTVSFTWVRHCLYSATRCPEPRLSDSGSDCTEDSSSDRDERAVKNACHYVCDAGTRTVPIHLPDTVTFRRSDSLEQWNGRLRFSGETLQDYVAPSLHRIQVRVPDERAASGNGAPVHVEVTLATGQRELRPYSRGKTLNLRTPDVLCTRGENDMGERAAFRYVGPLPYPVQKRSLENGIVALRPPQALAYDMRLAVGVGHEANPFGSHAVEPRWGQGIYYRLGAASFFPRLLPKNLLVEAFFDALIGSREYFVDLGGPRDVERSSGVLRLLFGAGVGFHSGRHVVVLGVAPGLSEGIGTNRDFVPLAWIVAPTLRWRIFVRGNSSVSLNARWLLDEQTRRFDERNVLLSTRDRTLVAFDLAFDWSLSSWLREREARDVVTQ